MENNTFKVFDENFEAEHVFKTLREATAYRYQQYGYAGYILEYDADGNEVANHS